VKVLATTSSPCRQLAPIMRVIRFLAATSLAYFAERNTLTTEILQIAEDENTDSVLAEKYPITAGEYGCVEVSGDGLAAMDKGLIPAELSPRRTLSPCNEHVRAGLGLRAN
jgi:hypothetical protein